MNNVKIMVVEDEAITGMYVKETLINMGYEISSVESSGEDAVKMASEKKPDLILMDIILSGKMNGIEASLIIKKNDSIPIIYMTGNANISTIQNARETNPYGYIIKPITSENLYSSIDTALNIHKMEKKLEEKNNELEKSNENLLSSNKKLHSTLDQLKITEENLKSSLQEKETILKEVHHRVKNNFQIIISLLGLQSRSFKDKNLLASFSDAINRIRSMSLTHENLYHSKDLNKIDFSLYISTLTKELNSVFSGTMRGINIIYDSDKIYLPLEKAIPCGLIVNELLSNTFKFAFPDNWNGSPEIKISFKTEENNIVLIISDNGIGFNIPVNINKIETVGLNLVANLSKQIGGKYDLSNVNGQLINKITFHKE
jgi:two-component sensor histidine kinase/AmiR/NasT family two-component response regulator